jgi:hypothetical protein
LVGSVLGLAVSPLQVSNLQRQYKQSLADDQAKKQAEADAKVQAETQKAEAERAVLQKQTDQIRQQMEQQQAIALPAPSEEIPVEEVQTDPLKNPLGNIRKSEVPFDIYKQIDDYRKQAGLPKLKEYSIEDFVDAMPGQNPKAEQALLDQLITAKSGYAGEKYTAANVLEQAGLKKIDTKTQGFRDFLTRTTGFNELEKMSQPQLHAAFKALASLPAATTSTILPEGTNASRYDEKQYDKAIKGVDFLLAELGVPVDPKEVIKTIKEYTNLTEDSHAGAILDAAIKNGDVDLIKTPRYEIYDPKTGTVLPSTYTSRTAARAAAAKRGLNVRQITTDAIAAPSSSVTLPEGFDIREGAFKEGEAPAGYELYAGDTLLTKFDTIEEANAKKASSERTRAGIAMRLENSIKQLNNAVEAGQKRLDRSEAKGEGQSTNFQKAAGRQAKLVAETQAKIASITAEIQKFDPKITPLEIKPTANKAIGRKGYTVFEQGQARATYPSRQAAEEGILADMDEKQLQELTQQQGRRAVGKKAQAELERRTAPKPTEGKPVSKVLEDIEVEAKAEKAKAEEAKTSPEVKAKLAKLEAELKPLLKQFGLGNIKLNFVEKLVEGNGSYNESLIKIALSAKEPVRVLRHESLHALKDLGFFTTEQWSALERMAKDKWIDKYLKSQKSEYKGKPTSRYDAYVDLYKGDMEKVTEEAIADAFADFDSSKAPPGMLAALLKRLNDFFVALRNALNDAGFQTFEDVFGKIERGELQSSNKTTKQGVGDDTGRKLSLRKSTARSGTGGGERLSITGAEEGRPEPARDGKGRDQVRGFTPLAGAPNVSGATGPDPSLVKVAEDYAKKYKIPYRRQASYVEIDEDFASLVAQAYDVMPHAPQNPKVKEAYQDLNRQTRDQYDALVDAGYTFTFFDSNTDPYDGNPFNAMRDLRKNKQMAVYGTYDGYGTEGITGAAVEDNPMLEDTGLRWPDQNGVEHMVTANDLFRAVHDAFGHGLEGAGFRARGEENAWQAHARLFTGPAVGAITSETRGQNSWLNFGPYGEKNRTAKIEDTVFAEQKTGLMPDWTWKSKIIDDEGVVLGSKQADAVSVKGLHYGKARVEELDASKYGSGVRGAERRRLEQTDDDRIKQRVYFYIAKPDGSTPLPEAGVGQYVYTQKFDNVLGQGPTMSRLFREANGDSNAFESLVVDSGYDGYAVPNMGMMVILNHNTPVNYKGTRSELADDQKRLSLNEAPSNSLLTKRMSNIGIKSTNDFWKRIQNVMIGTGSRNPSLGAALDTTSTSDQVKQAISVWKQDVEASGIQSYLQRFRIQGAVPEMDDVIAGPASVKKMLLEAGIRPTLGNAIDAYNSLPQSTVDGAVNDARYSLRAAPDTPEFKQFFAGSKVVDADGKPLVVYHGTQRNFTQFNTEAKNQLGAHFSASPEIANQFAIQNDGDAVYPAYVSLKNPYDIGNDLGNWSDLEALKEYLGPAGEGPFTQRQVNAFKTPADAVNALKDAGYDGIVYDNLFEGENKGISDSRSFIAFNPNQIKSATGNIGSYSQYNPDIRYSLRDSTDPDTLTRVNETTTAREEKGYVERITKALGGDTYSELRARSLNRYNRLSDVDKQVVKQRKELGGAELMADESAEAGALQSDLAAGVTASVLGVHDRNGGIPIYVNGVTKAFNDGGKIKGPVAIFAPLSKYNDPLIYQLYQFWAGVKRGSRLNAQGKPDIFTEDDVKRAEALEAKHPEFDQIQKEWTTFNNGLVQYLVDTGVLSEGDKARFTEFSDYIPFYRQMEGEKTIGPNIFQSISGVKKPKKLSEGTDKAPLADFLETIVRNTQSSIQMGMKNVAAQRAIDRALEIEMAERLRPNAPTGLDTVQVLEKGQVVTYQVADHLFIDAVKSLNMPELPFIGLLSGPANFLRNMVTKDPGFMLANMVRDSMAAYVTSGVKMTPVVDTISNFGKAMAGTSPEFEALLNAGIGGGYEFSQNIEMSAKAFEKELNKKYEGKTLFQRILNPMTAPTSLWEALEKGTTASDMATRIEVYKRTLEETGNEAEALHRALEVMNFNRKGSSPVIRILTAAIPFLNARMQGLDVLYRASFGEMNNKDAAMIQKRFIVRGLTMAALSAMYWTLTHDDEEYKKQEQETKDNNWLVPSLGIKIPIPFEIGVIFKVIPERIMALTLGQDTNKDFMDSMARNLRSTLAIDYLPQAIKPFVETETNFSLFTRRPIVGQGLEGVAPEFQIGPGTSSLAAFAGSNLGMSPMKIDHLIGGYTGTMGMYMVSALDGIMNMNAENPNASKRFEQLPFIKRFALDPEARGTVTGYYDLKNATDEVVRTSSLLERTMNFEERGKFMQENIKLLANKDYILDLEKTMKNFRQMQVMIRSSNMDADAKREALLRINQAQNALTANINTLRANVM